MAKLLNTYVHVADSKGETHVFGPEKPVPAWAHKVITNPNVWADQADADGASTDESTEDSDK